MLRVQVDRSDVIETVNTHLKALIDDIDAVGQHPLQEAAITFLKECTAAFDSYTSVPDPDSLHKSVILSALDLLQRWENWLASATFQHIASRVFHEFLLRFSKGMVKSYRIWRLDSLK